jgi:DNA-binding transcriptional regulator YdaS (Cro superfamily)
MTVALMTQTTRLAGDKSERSSVRKAIERAVAIIGSEQALARACGVTQPAVSKAKLQQRVSAELAKAIHKATEGAVPGNLLRPDLWRRAADVPIEIDRHKNGARGRWKQKTAAARRKRSGNHG